MLDVEAAIREIIADVRALREKLSTVVDDARELDAIERKLGALLPPIGGQFNINLSDLIKR